MALTDTQLNSAAFAVAAVTKDAVDALSATPLEKSIITERAGQLLMQRGSDLRQRETMHSLTFAAAAPEVQAAGYEAHRTNEERKISEKAAEDAVIQANRAKLST